MEQDVLQTSLSFLKRMVFNKGVTCSYLDSFFSYEDTSLLLCIVDMYCKYLGKPKSWGRRKTA